MSDESLVQPAEVPAEEQAAQEISAQDEAVLNEALGNDQAPEPAVSLAKKKEKKKARKKAAQKKPPSVECDDNEYESPSAKDIKTLMDLVERIGLERLQKLIAVFE